ncbi:MAG: RNA-binding transcriptional accessory protein [Chloroflexi bacterium]|nr:RNA-binding transcriptional accessory protein [Chloroflexota bacterium]
MNYDREIASSLDLQASQVAATMALLDDGNTIPFIARYRKEKTGSLDEDQIRQVAEHLTKLRALDDRRQTILNAIEEQGQLTPGLRAQIVAADSMTMLEDLYQPYKPKRRTRATIARERGLEPLARLILEQPTARQTPEQAAQEFLSDDVPTTDDALAGARDIVAETISDHAEVRAEVRNKALRFGALTARQIKDSDDLKGVYETYYAFENRVSRLKPYQVLAINRGEAEKVLRVKLVLEERDWQGAIFASFRLDRRSPFASELELAATDAAKRLLLPAIERDVRTSLTEQAEAHAIQVFATNLRGLLNHPPLAGQTVLGIDPAFRTGCKIAVIDPTGKVLETTTIYPHEPQRRWHEAQATLKRLIKSHAVDLIAIGNATSSRETEQLVADLTRDTEGVHYLIVNEAGASVYSASPLARQELPDLDVTLRGAVSIARRVLDPLAELVKIDPQSIGVGMYQHDVNQKQLGEALAGVVETVVNRVGVDVNTASPALLQHVAGIGPKLAENIVAYRDSNGLFANREMLKKVPKLGPKAFEQSAGFLRIRGGENPLDASAIHPESYPLAWAVIQYTRVDLSAPPSEREAILSALPLEQVATELDAGLPTMRDVVEQLARPGRDPRADLPAPILRSDVLSMDDLHIGLRLSGTVRNVVDFGAFIDIGVKHDGLLHRSQLPQRVKLGVGDIIEVEILNVEPDRGRISLGWALDM